MDEIIEILEEKNYIPSEIVEMLNGINQEEINKYAVKNNICPKCYVELLLHTWNEPQGECFGYPSYEEMCKWRCYNCGWVDD